MALRDILEFKIVDLEDFSLTVYNVLLVIIIWLVAWLIAFVTHMLLVRAATKRKLFDTGTAHAMHSLAKYFIYTLAIILSIEGLGFDITVIIAASTALFVGIGLGLQGYFTDIVSGFMILFEGIIKVGDIINYGDKWGIVQKIRLRTTIIENWDGNIIVIPNSKLTRDEVMNLSHTNQVTRFDVGINVAYGSDVEKVKKILLDAAHNHIDVMDKPEPFVRFKDFGDNGLFFLLMFFHRLHNDVQTVKSDLRFQIEKDFREHGVVIPFPQRDIHIRNSDKAELLKD